MPKIKETTRTFGGLRRGPRELGYTFQKPAKGKAVAKNKAEMKKRY